MKEKKVAVQEKSPWHVHDAAFGDTPETLFAAGQGKVAAFEWKA